MTDSESQEWILFDNVRDNNLKLEYLPFNDATPSWHGEEQQTRHTYYFCMTPG